MIETPLTLPCGHTVPNRLCKSAMTEGLADADDHATMAHERLYAAWARGGAAILMTGNIMVGTGARCA
jgi:2,4-dienoyl-CoA reductase-like NADH-dependent reductase (Old Yellow Enzyme family)